MVAIPTLGELAEFLRARLGDVTDTLGLTRPVAVERSDTVVSAAAPFAPTSYARARLLRQMHACGLLSADETETAQRLLGVAQ